MGVYDTTSDTAEGKAKRKKRAASEGTSSTETAQGTATGTKTTQAATAAETARTAKTGTKTASAGTNTTASGTSGAYSGAYDGLIRSLADNLTNNTFSYDVASDPLYRSYADRYVSNARLAMDDTLADAASYTGGYGSSYAQTAAQQAYSNALTGLNDILPELYELAYNGYRDDRADAQTALSTYLNFDARDYDRYRDTLSDAAEAEALAYQKEQDALAQENFLKELYAKYPKADPNYSASSGKSKSKSASSGTASSGTTADNCERFLKSLTSAQRQAVYSGTDAANTRYREEIIASVGQEGYEKLKQKYA